MTTETSTTNSIKKFTINDITEDMEKKEKPTEVLVMNLLPGNLYINLCGIIGKYSDYSNIESFFIVLENKDGIMGVEEIKREDGKSFNVIFNLKTEEKCAFTLLLYLRSKNVSFDYIGTSTIKAFDKSLRKYGTCDIEYEREDIKSWHNTLNFVDYKLKKRNEQNIIRRFLDLFEMDPPEIYGLQAQVCYIALEEQELIKRDEIKTLHDLQNWLQVRDNTYKQFFFGYVNLKGHNIKHCTHLWRRRYIEWNGYEIHIYNVYTHEKIGSIDVSNASVQSVDVDPKNFLKDNLMRINVEDGYLEAHFDSLKNYEKCLGASKHIFGRVHRIKNW